MVMHDVIIMGDQMARTEIYSYSHTETDKFVTLEIKYIFLLMHITIHMSLEPIELLRTDYCPTHTHTHTDSHGSAIGYTKTHTY